VSSNITFLTLLEREFYRFIRLAGQTVAPPVIMTVLFILIFGYSLGGRIKEIEGVAYIIFILPGLAGMGTINNSFSNCSTSLHMARMDRSIESILVAPISYFKMVSAFVMGGIARGMCVGGITLLVAGFLTELSLHSLIWTIIVFLLVSLFFASFGIIVALVAESWDHLATITNFVITPFVYLGGVFYSISMLPPLWQNISRANPLYYMIDAIRWAVLGHSDTNVVISVGITTLLALCSFTIAVRLFQKGYKLIV
jgi:ABC-2 type transport system permease protein